MLLLSIPDFVEPVLHFAMPLIVKQVWNIA